MEILGKLFGWIWVVVGTPLSLYFLLLHWKPGMVTTTSTRFVSGVPQEVTTEREGTWRDVVLFKAIAVVILSVCYLFLYWLLGRGVVPEMGARVALTTVLVAAAGGMLFVAGLTVSSRHELSEFAHTPQPEGDLVGDALAEGPADAFSNWSGNMVSRLLLRLPLGWLMLALLAAVFDFVSRKGGTGDVGVAAFSAVMLGLYVLFAGVWP